MAQSRTGSRACWIRALGGILVICLGLAVPGFAQAPQGTGKAEPGKAPSSSPTPRRGDTGGPMQFLVDTALKRSWTSQEFEKLAAANTTAKWKNKDNEEVPTIPLWTLLKEGGVSREAVKEVQIRSRSKVLLTLKGDDLGKLDQLVLRTGDSPNRPWRLGSLDPKDPNPFGRAVVRRIDVTTTASK